MTLHNMKFVFILIFLIVCYRIYVTYTRRLRKDVFVITYETDTKHKNLKSLENTLKANEYRYKVINEKKWKGFGGKIKKLKSYLRNLHPEQIVIITDARDVLSVNFKSEQLYSLVTKKDINNKVIVSTEIGCCVPAKFKPGQLRTKDGKVLNRTFDKKESKDNFDNDWKNMFKKRADKAGIKHPVAHKQSIYLNAGVYCGKVKNILKVYNLMNIDDKEDDQLIMSEIFYHYPDKFLFDYNREIFSNSHVWDSFNNKKFNDDTGCYYKKDGKIIKDTYLNSKPFFIHTPGKHFKCYDYIYESFI